MKTIFLSIIIISFTYTLFSQTTELEDGIMSSANEKYSLNYLDGVNNGRGNAGIGTTQDISGVLMNPAALEINMKHQLNFQYTYKTKQKWALNTASGNSDYYTEHIIPSVYLAYGLKLSKNISAGFIYHNPSSIKYNYVDFAALIGESDIYFNYNVHAFNLPVTYKSGIFRIGINISYTIYRNFMHGVTTEFDPESLQDVVSSFSRLNAQFGLLYIPSGIFSVGVTYTPGFKAYPKDDIGPVSTNIRLVSKYPMKLGAGIKLMAVKNKLNLFLDYNYSQISEIAGYKDKHDFNLGAELNLHKNFILRAGGFTFLDNRNFNDSMVSFVHPEGEYEQIFVTLGGSLKLNNVELNASIMDSHLSKGFIKNTYLNAGVVVNF